MDGRWRRAGGCGQFAQKNLKEDNNANQMVVVTVPRVHSSISHRCQYVSDSRALASKGVEFHSVSGTEHFDISQRTTRVPKHDGGFIRAGREGLIDTAVKTETGYIQCRLVKALEDMMVC